MTDNSNNIWSQLGIVVMFIVFIPMMIVELVVAGWRWITGQQIFKR